MEPSTTSRLARLARTVVWRGRFVVAALCCGLAAGATVHAVRPEAPPTREVVVTAREVPAGEPLRAADLGTATVAAELAPDGLLTDPADAVGRSPAVDLAPGIPVHADLVPGGGLADRAPEGTVVVGVRLTEAAWLRPGDRVDLLGTDDAADRLARRALVLPRLPADDGAPGAGGLLGSAAPATADAAVTLVAVDPDEAAAVSAAAGWGAVAAVLVP
ncbi:SAF domain-containing protein [Isoptericola sp. S6320L]|uniref:SAF domain-containing protein n=1 Tax=Isoptericola sp. S6320L TaxID=2926411 RepID=UPI001FF27CA3|nr:SAF domain-containing protein [Isoptericola sp. S6320L]MCK0118121.1 SAF domain-containing protein [Isoptericola sp. S6320L]